MDIQKNPVKLHEPLTAEEEHRSVIQKGLREI
jgi:hypothetical protein